MPFSEALKLSVKRRAHFSCVLCHTLGVEVHHILPQAENGSDLEDNAVPLCPSCHETYGANPEKRKFIRQSRDFWYELCEKRYASDTDRLEKILQIVQEASSKNDVGKVLDKIAEFQQSIESSLSRVVERERYISQIDQMQQRLLGIENEMQAKVLTLQQLRKREAVIHLGSQIATEIIESQASQNDPKVIESYGRASGTLIKLGNLTPERFVQIFEDAFKHGPVPEDQISQALYYVSVMYRNFYKLIVSIEASSSVVPIMIEEYDRSPDQPVSELQKALAARLRAKALE
jgi:hypothetical protein